MAGLAYLYPWVMLKPLGAVTVLALLLTGCVPALITPGPAPSDPPTTTAAAPPPQNYSAKLGQTFRWADGMAVKITGRMEPRTGPYDQVAKDGKFLALTIKLTNGSDEAVDVALGSADVTYGQDGEAAETAFVAEGAYNTFFTGKVSPGRSKTIKAAYVVTAAQAKDLTVQFAPSFEYDTTEFTGAVS